MARIEIVAEGRGMTFSGNVSRQAGNQYEVGVGQWQEGYLAWVSDIVMGDPDAKMPFLIHPDGMGEMALAFEVQDEDGNWLPISLFSEGGDAQ